MEDDFSFGNVWGDSSSPKAIPQSLLGASSQPKAANPAPAPVPSFDIDDDFADFDDPPAPSASASTSAPFANGFGSTGDDDDFGDFGDFGDDSNAAFAGTTSTAMAFDDDDGFGSFNDPSESTSFQQPSIRTYKDWHALQLDPVPSLADLTQQTDSILEPFWDQVEELVKGVFTDDVERQVEGVAQVLVTPESRSLYHTLLETPLPPTNPPNWTRSRIRRQHLITLGIPINLDEVLAPVSPLPPSRSSTLSTSASAQGVPRPSSAPPTPRLANVAAAPGPRSATPKPSGLRNAAVGGSASGRSTPTRQATTGGIGVASSGAMAGIGTMVNDLGPAPALDLAKIDEMLALDADTLPLLPLPLLNAHLDTLRSLTATTSSVLTHLLQQREALQQDSEAYNAVIADMIQKETQKMRLGGTGTKGKRGSVL